MKEEAKHMGTHSQHKHTHTYSHPQTQIHALK